MKTINISAIQSVNLNQMFETPPEPPKGILCKFRYNQEELTAMNNSLTIILNRDIHSSMEHASELSIFLARQDPDRKVLLINTYAGTKFMQDTLMKGLISLQIALPKRMKYTGGIPEAAHFTDDPEEALLPNLQVLNCPIATLDAARLEAEVTKHGSDIVILNSFEFSSLSRPSLWNFARGIVELREKKKLAMVVYSQQFRASISPYFIGRGAMGMMAPFADSIWKVYSGFESVHISHKNMKKINELNSEDLNAVH